jgi:hypothetical protein
VSTTEEYRRGYADGVAQAAQWAAELYAQRDEATWAAVRATVPGALRGIDRRHDPTIGVTPGVAA